MNNLERHRYFLTRIRDVAKDGQNGSAAYALDRLRLIEEIAEIGINGVERDLTKMEAGE